MQIRIPGPLPDGLTVFETMRREADGRIALWPRHLDRLRAGCAAVGFALDESAVMAALAGLPTGAPLRVRLSVDAGGGVAITQGALPAMTGDWRVTVSGLRLRAGDPWLSVKTSHRPVYDAARAALPPGMDEALLLNTDGQVCEGTITTVFLRHGDMLLTPPLSCGLLPGVLRAQLLAQGHAREAAVTPAMLAEGAFFCGNALRGLIPARLVRGPDAAQGPH